MEIRGEVFLVELKSETEKIFIRQGCRFVGFLYAASTVGPAVGYLLGGMLLNIYTDFRVVDVDS